MMVYFHSGMILGDALYLTVCTNCINHLVGYYLSVCHYLFIRRMLKRVFEPFNCPAEIAIRPVCAADTVVWFRVPIIRISKSECIYTASSKGAILYSGLKSPSIIRSDRMHGAYGVLGIGAPCMRAAYPRGWGGHLIRRKGVCATFFLHGGYGVKKNVA